MVGCYVEATVFRNLDSALNQDLTAFGNVAGDDLGLLAEHRNRKIRCAIHVRHLPLHRLSRCPTAAARFTASARDSGPICTSALASFLSLSHYCQAACFRTIM